MLWCRVSRPELLDIMRLETNTPSVDRSTAMFSLLFIVVVIWGITWPIMKIGLSYIPPLFFGSLRMFVGATFMFLLTFLSHRFIIPRRTDLGIILSVGLLQMAIPTALMHFSLTYVDAGRASLLAFTHPIWIAPAAVMILKEPLNRGTAGGLVVGISGILVLFNPLGFDWGEKNTLVGNGLLLGSAMSWAAGIIHVRAHNWSTSPLALSPWQMLVAGIVLISLSFWREDVTQTVWTQNLIFILAFVGIAATAFAYWGAVTVSRALPAMISSLGFLGVPVVGILSSVILLSEKITITLMIGTTLILIGLVIMTVFGRGTDGH